MVEMMKIGFAVKQDDIPKELGTKIYGILDPMQQMIQNIFGIYRMLSVDQDVMSAVVRLGFVREKFFEIDTILQNVLSIGAKITGIKIPGMDEDGEEEGKKEEKENSQGSEEKEENDQTP